MRTNISPWGGTGGSGENSWSATPREASLGVGGDRTVFTERVVVRESSQEEMLWNLVGGPETEGEIAVLAP